MDSPKMAVYGIAAGLTILIWVFAYNLEQAMNRPSTSSPERLSPSVAPGPSFGVVQGPVILNQGSPPTAAGPTLSPIQERLLELLAGYQRRFGARKLVVSRNGTGLHFDDDPTKGAEVSVVKDLYGSTAPERAREFEELMESLPPEYLRMFPEPRLDGPFVVTVTEKGMQYLRR